MTEDRQQIEAAELFEQTIIVHQQGRVDESSAVEIDNP
jgi:hypothetical protein